MMRVSKGSEARRLIKPIRRAWEIVRGYRRAYLVLNLVYYGLVLLGMAYVWRNPSPQEGLLGAVAAIYEALEVIYLAPLFAR